MVVSSEVALSTVAFLGEELIRLVEVNFAAL